MNLTKARTLFIIVVSMLICTTAFYYWLLDTSLSRVKTLKELNFSLASCKSLVLDLSLNNKTISSSTELLEKHIDAIHVTDKTGLRFLTKTPGTGFEQLVYNWKFELLPQFGKLSSETSNQLNRAERDVLLDKLNALCVGVDTHSRAMNNAVIANLASNKQLLFFSTISILLLLAYFMVNHCRGLYSGACRKTGRNQDDGNSLNTVDSNKLNNPLTGGNKTDIQQYISSLDIAHKALIQLVEEPESTEPFTLFLTEIEKLTAATSSAIYMTSNPGAHLVLLTSTDLNDQDWTDAIPARVLPKVTAFDKSNKIMVVYEKTIQADYQFICVQLHQGSKDFSLLVLKLALSIKLADAITLTLLEYSERLASIVSSVRLARLKLRHAQYDERAVIARELHDSLAQSLSYLKIQASRLQGILTDSDIQAYSKAMEIDAMMQDLRSNLNIAYRHLRELISTFRLTMGGKNFSQALTDSVEEFAKRSSIAFDIDNRLPIDILSVTEETQLLHIIRESLSNVVRHSQAKSAIISIHYDDLGQITTRIEDDGIGIPDIANPERRFGIIIMQERAHSINGSISLSERAKGGACIKIIFRASKHSAGTSNF